MVFPRKFTLNLTLILNVLLIFLSVFEDKMRVPVLLQVSGRLHPAVIHFPLVLLFVAIFIEWVATKKKNQFPVLDEIVAYVLYAFALSAVLGALFGLFLFNEGSYQGDDIKLHRWLGTAVSILAALTLVLKEKSYTGYYYGALAVTAVCLTVAGHVGSEVTHGKGFVMEPVKRQQKRIEIENPDSAIVFRDVIQPILNEKCASCHNSNKAKNDLILTDYKAIMNGGENQGGVVSGAAAKSLIYKYVILPMSDTLHMPPEGKLQLDREEIKLIGWWINAGAAEHEKYVQMSKVDSIHSIMLARFKPKKGIDLVNIAFADPAKIKALSNPYRNVSQISAVKPYVAVFLGSKKDFNVNDLKELGDISQQIVSIDLGNSAVTNSDIKALAEFPHLQKLHLQNIPITNDALQSLHSLRYLEVLNLSGTKITSKALDEISGWKNLKKLYIYNTSIDSKSVDAVKIKNSQLEVFNTQLDLTDSLYDAQLTAPIVKVDSQFFRGRATIDVKPSRGKVNYFYTLDGTEPTSGSTRYVEPFQIMQSSTLKVIATMTGWTDSRVVAFSLVKLGVMPEMIQLNTKPDLKLSAKSDSVLVDGKAGSLDRNDKAYLVFAGQDFDVTFETKTSGTISRIALSFLKDTDQGIFQPGNVEVWGGMEKDKLVSLGKTMLPLNENKSATKGFVSIDFPRREIRFIRLKAKNVGVLPAKHPLAKKSKPMLYIDEVALD